MCTHGGVGGGGEEASSLAALWLTWDDGSKQREIASLLYIAKRWKENIAMLLQYFIYKNARTFSCSVSGM